MLNLKTNKLVFIIIFFISFLGIFIRAYNINYDNFWFDEILSFWVADPKISIIESWERHRSIEQVPFLYNLLLKALFEIFSYNVFIGRYLSLIFNILSIFFIIKTSRLLKKNNSYIFSLFLLSFNVYLISYSQELRAYSLVLFLCSTVIYYFFKSIKCHQEKKFNLYLLLINSASQILMIYSHPFTLIVYFSIITVIAIKYFKFNESFRELNLSIIISLIFSFFYLYFYINDLSSYPSWLEQPGLKFYTNFYFSTFFGSRLVGLFYLITLLFLLFNFKKMFFKNVENLTFFLVLLFLSYFLPLVFGYLIKPIIFHRYIIFVLIPIIILISILIFEIKNQKIKIATIIIISVLTIGNLYTESTVQQFIKERPYYKPEFSRSLDEINKSNEKYYTFDMDIPPETRASAFYALENYIIALNKIKKYSISYFEINEFENSKKKTIWTICLPIITKDKCKNLNPNLNSKTILSKNFSAISLKLIKKNN